MGIGSHGLMKQKKRIVSFNLEDSLIARLDRFAEQKHKGNRSRALAYLVSTINVTLDDFKKDHEEHTGTHQNFRDTGKCSPFVKGHAPCPTCWGENVSVRWEDGIVDGRMGRVLVVEDLT